jgi:hypothetical protein
MVWNAVWDRWEVVLPEVRLERFQASGCGLLHGW